MKTLVDALFASAEYARRSSFLAGVDTTAKSNLFSAFWAVGPDIGTQAALSGTNVTRVPVWDPTNGWSYWPGLFTTNFGWGAPIVAAHGLPGTPQSLRWVLLCVTNTSGGYVVGDELPVTSVTAFLDYPTFSFGFQAFSEGANSSNVFLRMTTDPNAPGFVLRRQGRPGGADDQRALAGEVLRALVSVRGYDTRRPGQLDLHEGQPVRAGGRNDRKNEMRCRRASHRWNTQGPQQSPEANDMVCHISGQLDVETSPPSQVV